MSPSDAVCNAGDLQSGCFDAAYHIVGVVDFAVAVCHGGKVDTGLGEAVGGCLIALPVPKRFHNIKDGVFVHGVCRTAQNGNGFLFGKTVKELAHPDCIKSAWERNLGIE